MFLYANNDVFACAFKYTSHHQLEMVGRFGILTLAITLQFIQKTRAFAYVMLKHCCCFQPSFKCG